LLLTWVRTLLSPTAPIVSGGMVKVVVPTRGPSSCARKLAEGAGAETAASIYWKPQPGRFSLKV